MKKAIAIIVSVLFVLSVAGLSFAAEQKAAPAEKKEAAAKTEKKAKAKIIKVTGEVTAVDAKAMTLTVKGKKGDVALTVDDKTKFAKGKSLADVKVGDKATVSYAEVDGKMVAKSVAVKAAEAKKEKKEMKKEEKKTEKKADKPAAAAPAPAPKKAGGY